MSERIENRNHETAKQSGVEGEIAFLEFIAGHPEILGVEIVPSTERPFVDPIATPFRYGEEASPKVDRASLTQLWSTDMYSGKEIKDGSKQD